MSVIKSKKRFSRYKGNIKHPGNRKF
uniref:Uncharacterized protein n=1 Tax=Anguilla anguilla TaxID=7936 RepID=A0A0E9UU01_ANGAN